MIISFSLTKDKLLKGFKTQTRRNWKETHVEKFFKGKKVDAWDALPYNGGQIIAFLKLTKDPYKQPISEITPKQVADEGFDGMTPKQFIEEVWIEMAGGTADDVPTVIEFEVKGVMLMGKYEHSEPFRFLALVPRYPRQGDVFTIQEPDYWITQVRVKRKIITGGQPFYYIERTANAG